MREHIQAFASNPNFSKAVINKAKYIIDKMPTTSNNFSQELPPAIPRQELFKNQTFHMNDSSTVNYTINSNGKRPTIADPFNTPGGENSSFFNKLLKTASNDEDSLSPQLEDDFEEEEIVYEANISHLSHEDDKLQSVIDKIKSWKTTAVYQPIIHKQDLSYYNIVNTTTYASSTLNEEEVTIINEVNTVLYHEPEQISSFIINLGKCCTFDDLQVFYQNNKNNLHYSVKKIIKLYLNNKYDENINLFTDRGQKEEDDYKFHFVAPVFEALFKNNQNIKKEWGESPVGKTKVDGLLSLVDEEGTMYPVSLIEISGLALVGE